MTTLSRDITLLAEPLVGFYQRLGVPMPALEVIAGAAVPEPYRGLLVHHQDMTPTLAAHHGAPIVLQPISTRQVGDRFFREVLLVREDNGALVEYGAIHIELSALPEPARRAVLECHTPLGAILAEHKVAHSGNPGAFFRVKPDNHIGAALRMTGLQSLYGRCNTLTGKSGELIAQVVEVLPPM